MCGIAGLFSYRDTGPPVDVASLRRIHDHMAIRGPDGEGVWQATHGRVALSHRRLAIIDLSEAGAQPMKSADSDLCITFNGEIYNYKALQADLRQKGHVFKSQSDTEVLLHLYSEYGREMVHHLRGMYTFAIWSESSKSLFLARDPFGIKPLYFADDGKTFRFASQVKALLAGGSVDASPSAAGHAGFYLWGHLPDPFTLYQGIRALEAGHSLMIKPGGAESPQKFFDLGSEIASLAGSSPLSDDDSRAMLHEALKDSVAHHFVADVPVGIFLSSGLDSSTITALSSELEAPDLRTITLGFDEYRNSIDDEAPLAELVARAYRTSHQTKWISRSDFNVEYERLLAAMDQPSIDGVNTYFVSRAAHQTGLKVALSGLGGDELFGGYPTFNDLPRLVNLVRPFNALPAVGKLIRGLSSPILDRFTSPKYAGVVEYGGDYPQAYMLRRALHMPWELNELLGEPLTKLGLEELQSESRLGKIVEGIHSAKSRVSALELSWYMRDRLLRDSDWAGMAHSLEIRVPFVDVKLFRTVAAINASRWLGKADMARAPKVALPREVLERRKTGFSVPVRDWLASRDPDQNPLRGLRGWARQILPPRTTRALALVSDAYGGYGGIAEFNRNFLASLCTHPDCMTVVALPRLMTMKSEPQPQRLQYRIDGLRGKFKYVWAVFTLLCRQTKFDVVYCGHIYMLPIAYFASKVCGAPLVLIIHGIDAWQPTTSRLTNMLVRKVDAFVAVSALTQGRFKKWAAPEKAQELILPNTVKLENFAAGPRDADLEQRYNLHGKLVVMTIGRLASAERYKGFDEVIEALPELVHHIPNIVYLIGGQGPDRGRLEAKARELGVADRVIFTGFIRESEKAAHYRLADVYVMASRGEGFGIVTLEAVASGIPTIASRIDGGREALRDGMLGTLIDPDQPSELIAAVIAASQKPKTVPEGIEYFSYANFENRVHAIQDQIVEGR